MIEWYFLKVQSGNNYVLYEDLVKAVFDIRLFRFAKANDQTECIRMHKTNASLAAHINFQFDHALLFCI